MKTLRPLVKYALLSDPGRVRLSNEDAASCVESEGIFVVSDGMGGLPAGGAASNVIARALPPLLIRGLNHATADTEDRIMEALLFKAAAALSTKMHDRSRECAGLQGWGATMVAVLLRGAKAHVLNVGDSRAYLLRNRRIVQLTNDDSVINRVLNAGLLITADFEQKHRNLVSQHVAMKEPILPAARTIAMRPGDRLLLCTDGLCGPLDDARIGRLLHEGADPADACKNLIEEANKNGGPDNITTTVIDWQGTREVEAAPLPSAVPAPPAAIEPPAEAAQARRLLETIEQKLHWILEASQQVMVESSVSAQASLKRLLGEQVYRAYFARFPKDTPAQALHQACLQRAHPWRKEYDQAMTALDPLMMHLTGGQVAWSALLSNDDAALVLKALWNEYRKVERYYFSVTLRNPLSQQERTLHIFVQHMHESARTLAGLMEFLPGFVV